MDVLLTTVVGKPLWMWAVFLAIVLFLMALDLGVFHREQKEIGVKESLQMSAFYIMISLIFGAWVFYAQGVHAGEEYLTGYLVEKTLSMDNIFVISLIFAYFKIPRIYQHRVLFWGVLGVIILRGIMIGAGAALVSNFHWVLYIFALFLIITGVKMLKAQEDEEESVEDNPIIKFFQSRLRVTQELHGEQFFVKKPDEKTGKIITWCTPLFLTLVTIEFIDLVFAVDSIPAIFAITTDTYVIYTSNIFAILGLRSLYFALAAVIERFAYLKKAMALVLVFIGSKVFIADMMGWEKFPASWSLGITVGLLTSGVIYSLYMTRNMEK